MADMVRMASMIAAQGRGVTLEQARAMGLVKDVDEEQIWQRLAADAAKIAADGGVVEVPNEWFG